MPALIRWNLFVLILLTLPALGDKKEETSGYVPFPSGYGYMVETQRLQKATDKNEKAYIRSHAWRLWAGIMQPAGRWPLWMTWPNTGKVFSSFETSSTEKQSSQKPLRAVNRLRSIKVNTNGPLYPVPEEVKDKYPEAICGETVCDGKFFVNNGDILIPTESLSRSAAASLVSNGYTEKSVLDRIHDSGEKVRVANDFIVTKHMYWPVKSVGFTPLPVWSDNFPVSYPNYAGYETWGSVVAIDPTGNHVGEQRTVKYLYGLDTHDGTNSYPSVEADATVVPLDSFYHVQVTAKDWEMFSDADKAIISASSYWLNGEDFEVGDYLATVAMHVNTKELPSWTLQSVWWSHSADSGPFSEDRPLLPRALGPWRNYLLTTSYAVPPNADGEYDVAVNPYIEGVIHPIATSCRNCHVRAGWPLESGAGNSAFASYQNANCPGLLEYLTPESDCFEGITLTDYLWIIPDRAR